jgi:diaminopimelate epimerase
MRFSLIHCHGSGNDFPLIDARGLDLSPADWAQVARALADRAGPVGGDGLLLLREGRDGAAFAMEMRNSDGSEAETCLNGLRCVARLGFDQRGGTRATVALKTSLATVERAADLAAHVAAIRETAAPVSLAIADWPLLVEGDAEGRLIDAPVPPLESDRRFTAVAIPNPHLVTFVERVDEGELVAIGRACEAAPPWLPNRANVSFVERRAPDTLFVRTFERGVGLTDSCGSAMGASSFAACLTGRVDWDTPLTVFNKGGLVEAQVARDGAVTLTGNATWQWAGHVEVDLATATASGLVIERQFEEETAAWAGLVAGLVARGR